MCCVNITRGYTLCHECLFFTGTTLIACAGLSAGSGGGADQRGCYRAGGGEGDKRLNEEREWGIGVHFN